MLQRIYGTVWPNPKELDLFSLHEEAGPGLVYWHPKGSRIRNEIETFWKNEHFKNGYEILYTPHVGKSRLWETSGHESHYQNTAPYVDLLQRH